MTDAVVIPLDIWQDPQSDIVLIYSEYECSVYFNCWITSGKPADFLGQLSFERAVGVRSFTREFLPYRIPTHRGHSYALLIPDSDLVREHVAYRELHYADSSFRPPIPKHYVVVGHDIYHEILADGIATTTIPKQGVSDPRLLRLIAAE